ncbi:MAG: PIN domain-containing protein, partial [Nitrococcus sp.]|nr:PIN domain-containing protein [Nitrococcus sp.]
MQRCLGAATQPLVITDYILCETLTLLRYRLGWKTAHVFGTSVLGGDIGVLSNVTRLDREAAWQIFTRYRDKSFSFTDCTSFAHMERLKIDAAVALDHDFRGYGL